MWTRIRRGVVATACVAALTGIGSVASDVRGAAAEEDAAKAANEAAAAARRTAIRRGVAFLAEQVPKLREADGSPRRQFTQATTGLVLLLDGTSAAHAPARGDRLGDLTTDLARWLARVSRESRDPERLPSAPGIADSRCLVQYVWPVAQAVLMFAEMDARNVRREEARSALRVCVQILAEAREANGGWGHGRVRPRSASASGNTQSDEVRAPGGYPDTLLASTNVAAIALGVAGAVLGKDAVPDLEPTRAYYRAAQLRNGSFPYDPSQRSADRAETNAGRSAGALVAMQCLAMPRDDGWKAGAKYVEGALDLVAEGHGSPCLNVFHGALAFRLLGDEQARRFRARFEPGLVRSQAADGSTPCPCDHRAFGVTCDDPPPQMPAIFSDGQRIYATSLNVLTLLLLDGRTLRSVDRVEPAPAATSSKR